MLQHVFALHEIRFVPVACDGDVDDRRGGGCRRRLERSLRGAPATACRRHTDKAPAVRQATTSGA